MSCQRAHALITGTSSGIGHATMNAAAAGRHPLCRRSP
jgi:NAD(P)-dependent dehydrogenase (short-subunit alcohol dehydrogenase family)